MAKLELIEPDDSVSLYYHDVGSFPLLSREQETTLGKRIERGQQAKQRLEDAADELDSAERALLKADVQDGDEAFVELVQSNFRLVISIAKKYTGYGVPLLDLVQEGNLGLIHAAEKFDYRKGCRFSTYATWWIRQAVSRAVPEERTIRIPMHVELRLRHLNRLARRLESELGRRPTPEEMAEAADLSLDQVQLVLNATRQPASLEQPVDDRTDCELGDLIESERERDPADEVDLVLLSEEIEDLLSALPLREARILKMRYGLKGGHAHTLKEVGDKFGLTRERIRQIEQEALAKLRHPQRSQRLRAYLN